MKRYFLLLICTLFVLKLSAQNSILASGEIYKIAVAEHGVYKIDRQFLVEIGVDVENLNPKNIHIFGNRGGMLPQPNNSPRTLDLEENAIYVEGEADGSFDAQDFILFYAEGANQYFYDDEKQLFNYENNLYADLNYFFIKIDQTEGKRIQERASLNQNTPVISSFDYFQYHERDIDKIEQDIFSGREWYGERFDFQDKMSFDFSMDGILPNSEMKVFSAVVGRSTDITLFSIFVNDNLLGTHRVSSINPLGIGRYDYKGRHSDEIFTAKSSETETSGTVNINVKFDKQGVNSALGFMDFILLNTERELKYYGENMRFRSLKSTNNQFSKFQISDFPSDALVWDVTDPHNTVWQNINLESNQVNFTVESQNLREYQIFRESDVIAPTFVQKIDNQNIKSLETPDLLIVTHPDFLAQAQRLADFRQSNDNVKTQVVTVQQIYNEFSSGRQDVTAIRDFVKYLYDKSDRLKYLLLFGDASYDYKNRIGNFTNYVPVYESRESLHPIFSYASDDYYGFMGDSEGFWGEGEAEDEYDLEIGVGRMPVKTEIEAISVVNKLIRYDSPEAMGSWRNQICFVADDADYNLHFNDTERLTNRLEANYGNLNLQKLYVDAFPQVLESVEKRSPAMREELQRTIESGTLLVNFIGHGSETSWTSEQVFDFAIAGKLQNPHQMPLVVTATCEFGRFDYHLITGAEYAVLNPNGGAIGMLTTTRPVYSNTNAFLTRAFYNTVFEPINGEMPRLGDVIRITKNNSLSGIRNRNFSLLGDPSMRLAYPKETVKVNEIRTSERNSTTLKALDNVTVIGEIQKNGQLDASFNGTLDIKVFDKPAEYQTLGDEDPEVNLVADYELQNHRLFKGTARVENGKFEFQFIVPKDIDYQLGTGKISLYAHHDNQYLDAGGYSDEFEVGGTATNVISDTNPPELQIFMDTTSFQSGDVTGVNPQLLAFFTDESGINLTGNGLGHEMVAILDDEEIFVLNDFYEADLGTYKSGQVTFPFTNLSEGEHHLKVQVWDTHNNFSEAELTFVVQKEPFSVSEMLVYPNPFTEETQFSFRHNRAGDDLKITLEVYETTGKLARQIERTLYVSAEKIENLRWDGTGSSGNKLRAGLYIYRLRIQSIDTQETNFKSGKLVIIK